MENYVPKKKVSAIIMFKSSTALTLYHPCFLLPIKNHHHFSFTIHSFISLKKKLTQLKINKFQFIYIYIYYFKCVILKSLKLFPWLAAKQSQ